MMAADSRCRVANLPIRKKAKVTKPNNTANYGRYVAAVSQRNQAIPVKIKNITQPSYQKPTTQRLKDP